MSSNPSPSFVPIDQLPKIKKIHKRPLEAEEEFHQKLTKKSCLVRSTVRVLYRDFVKMLSSNHLLDYTEAQCANGHFKSMPGETLVLSEHTIGSDAYRNIRMFRTADKSITVLYIFFATVFQSKSIDELQYLLDNDLEKSIDIIFLSSYVSDINHRKVSHSNLSFEQYFNKYMIEVENTCIYLQQLCKNNQNLNQLFYWLTPTPNHCVMSEPYKAEFEKNICDLNTIVTRPDFKICDRYDIWTRRRDLVVTKTGYFSLHEIREINDWLARDVAKKWRKPFTSSIPS